MQENPIAQNTTQEDHTLTHNSPLTLSENPIKEKEVLHENSLHIENNPEEKIEEKPKKSLLSSVFPSKNNTIPNKTLDKTNTTQITALSTQQDEHKEISLPPIELLSPVPEQKDAPKKPILKKKGKNLFNYS